MKNKDVGICNFGSMLDVSMGEYSIPFRENSVLLEIKQNINTQWRTVPLLSPFGLCVTVGEKFCAI